MLSRIVTITDKDPRRVHWTRVLHRRSPRFPSKTSLSPQQPPANPPSPHSTLVLSQFRGDKCKPHPQPIPSSAGLPAALPSIAPTPSTPPAPAPRPVNSVRLKTRSVTD